MVRDEVIYRFADEDGGTRQSLSFNSLRRVQASDPDFPPTLLD